MKTPAARRPGRGHDEDEGSAVVEFVSLGMLMLLPMLYLILTMGRLQAAAYATDGSARAAARAVTRADSLEAGVAAARAAVRLGMRNQGFDVDPASALAIRCSASPCLTPEARVEATVTVDVLLPGVPAFLDDVMPTHIPVTARQAAAVDRFRVVGESP